MFAYTEGPFSFWTILLFSLCFGVASGVLYEGMRFLRVAMEMILTCKSKSTFLVRFAIVFLLDLLFFICISVAAVLFLFVCNRGQLRLSILGMMAFGFYLYNVNIGRHVRRMHRRVLKFVYRYILRYVLAFAAFLYQKTVGVLIGCVYRQYLSLYERVMIAYAKRRMKQLIVECREGFGKFDEYVWMD